MTEMFPSRWLKGEDLQGHEPTVTIARVTFERIQQQDGTEEEKPVVWFQGKDKALILNRTNADAIAELYGDETDAWPGCSIKLVTERVSAFGKMHDAIRIRTAANGHATATSMTPNEPPPVAAPASQPFHDDDDLPF